MGLSIIYKVEGLLYLCRSNKGTDQLCGNSAADLHLCFSICIMWLKGRTVKVHGVQRRMISVDNFFVFLRLLYFALLLLYVT